MGVFNDRHDGVTVRNGSVRGFGVGVFIGGVRGNRLVGLSSSQNQYFGFVIADSPEASCGTARATDNPRPDGDGLGVFVSHDLRIVGNSFRRNGQIGMHIENSPRNLVKGNAFVRNGDFGILIEGDRNQVLGNRFVRNGVAAIQLGPGSRNVIAGNRIAGGRRGDRESRGDGATWSPATWSCVRAMTASASGYRTPRRGRAARCSPQSGLGSGRMTASGSQARRMRASRATSRDARATTASTSTAHQQGSGEPRGGSAGDLDVERP